MIFEYLGVASPRSTIVPLLASSFASNFQSGQIRSSTAVAGQFGLGWNDDGISQFTVAFVRYGDSDLNGVINFDDYAHIDNGFNNHLTGWFNGDFDYNGVINFDDYALIDVNFNNQRQPAMNAVPEPSGAGLLFAVAAGVSRSRRTRRSRAAAN